MISKKKIHTLYIDLSKRSTYVYALLLVVAFVLSTTIIGQQAGAHKHRTICSQFKTQEEAQIYYDSRDKGYTSLYVNKDGKVCSTLPKLLKGF